MSRIGKQPVEVPGGVDVSVAGSMVTVKGKSGELKQKFHPDMGIEFADGLIIVTRPSNAKHHRGLHGLTRALIQNMVTGITTGFKKELEIIGVGWNAKMKGKQVSLQIGFCHTVEFDVPQGVSVELRTPQRITISGIEKQKVGQFAAQIRKVRPPEPYKGKGIRYKGEHVIRKVGKSQVGM